MDSSHFEHNRWLDRELREVPLPEGMLARLREIAAGDDDAQLDALIGDVRLPAGLLEGLRQIVKDERLDRALQMIDVPDGLIDRLQAAVAEEQHGVVLETGVVLEAGNWTDTVIDEQLRDVAVPSGLLGRLGQMPRLDRVVAVRRTISVRQWATAASLLLTVGLSYFGFVFALIFSAYQVPTPAVAIGSVELSLRIESAAGQPIHITSSDENGPLAESPFAQQLLLADLFDAEFEPRESFVSPWDEAQRISSRGEFSGFSAVLNATGNGERALFGSEDTFDEIPPLLTVARRRISGLKAPIVRGYDRTFLARRGVHPFVSPAANAVLRESEAPLTSQTRSFDLLWQRIDAADGRTGNSTADLPAAGSLMAGIHVRPEEFLAAMDYEFEKPLSGALALRTAAGPSPFASRHLWILTDQNVRLATGPQAAVDDIRMIHVGVQAGDLPAAAREHRPTHLTVALDVSASMRWQGRLALARAALATLADRLHDSDRISLVTFSDQSQRLAEDVSRQSAADFHRVVRSLQVEHGTNFGAGLRGACAAAIEGEGPRGVRRRLVILTDAPSLLDRPAREQIETMLAGVHASGVELTIVDLSRGLKPDEQLSGFVHAAGGRIVQADSASQVRRLLQQELSGRSQIVAHDARLRVKFNPRSVIGYRLIGHEASAGLLSGSSTVDLSAGESATALFEIILHPNNENYIATARLSWQDQASGQLREVRQEFHRRQFATSLASSPVALQIAILAAETAESLRQSQSLRPVREAAYEADPDLQRQFEFRRLIELIEETERGASY